jgi:hypothetical protein
MLLVTEARDRTDLSHKPKLGGCALGESKDLPPCPDYPRLPLKAFSAKLLREVRSLIDTASNVSCTAQRHDEVS